MITHNFLLTSVFLAMAVFSPLHGEETQAFEFQDGDIVFSGSAFGQGAAIIAATGSPFTHCGVVFRKDGRWMVLEAVQPVGVVTLEGFMARGRKESFTALRLKTVIAPDAFQKAREWATGQVGRDYDLQRPEVKKIIEERYGRMDLLPMDEKVVAPSDLAASKLLIEVPRKRK